MSNSLYFGQIVIGPAGSGKSTYCKILQDAAETYGRNFIIVNLDPAADKFFYRCDIDVRDLITLNDAQEEMQLGPNGGLVFCLEYILDNIDLLLEKFEGLKNDDYILFDCPGQIELYCHLDIMQRIIKKLGKFGFSLISVFLMDCTFMNEDSKFISGMMVTLATLINLGLPHLTILSKCDQVTDKKLLSKFVKKFDELDVIKSDFIEEEGGEEVKEMKDESKQKTKKENFDKKFQKLTNDIKDIVDDYNLVNLMPLDVRDEETVRDIIAQADIMMQYDEHIGPSDKIYEKMDMMNEGSTGNEDF